MTVWLGSARFFSDLRRKYAHPIMVVNLVKRREKRHHENLLHEQFLKVRLLFSVFVKLCIVFCNKRAFFILHDLLPSLL